MTQTRECVTYVVCLRNDDVPASLEVRKIYEAIDDEDAAKSGMVRVIDESGEDYLYPGEWFAPIELSAELRSAFQLAS